MLRLHVAKKSPARFKKMREVDRRGWTVWVYPTPDSYFMKCCDCGLVHEMQFGAFVELRKKRNGTFEILDLPPPFRAKFRARRARKPRVP